MKESRVMKTKNLILSISLISILSVITVCSCQYTNETSDPISDMISLNLSKDGKIDPELLIGEWDCIMFAYTADGCNILNETALSCALWDGRLTIPVVPTPKDYIVNGDILWEALWRFHYINSHHLSCSLSGNSIKLNLLFATKKYDEPECIKKEIDITTALKNAYSFVVKDNELIIYFTGVEDKNLLIFKKAINHEK